jgi:hypothetical protein
MTVKRFFVCVPVGRLALDDMYNTTVYALLRATCCYEHKMSYAQDTQHTGEMRGYSSY